MKRFALLPVALALLAVPLAADGGKNPRPAHVLKSSTTEKVVPPPPVAQDYEPKPAMWKLADADTTIYLFGTFHILPSGFRWRTAVFDRAVTEAEELIVETSDKDADEQLETLGPAMMGTLKERTVTSAGLAAENQAKWRRVASTAGMSFAVFDRMPVLFAMIGAGLSLSKMQGSAHEYGVETVLEAEFAKAGKPVGSIENPATVMRGLLAVDEAPLIAQLDKDLSAWDGKDIEGLFAWQDGEVAEPFAEEHGWAKGELTPVFTAETMSEPGVQAIHDVLLTDRNHAWADWLKMRLDKPGVVLVAVGAGHFAGDVSVLELLTARGLKAERVQ